MEQGLLFQRHIQRLERRLARCEDLSRHYSSARLAIFLAGGVATWAAASLSGPLFGWMAFFLAAILFSGIVILHRRVDHWAGSFRIWQAI